MDNLLYQIADYPIPIIIAAVFATFATGSVKLLVKDKIKADDDKQLSEKLSNISFFSCLVFSLLGYFVNVIVCKTPVAFAEMAVFTVCSLSASELIYSVYETVGLKKAVKAIIELLTKEKSTLPLDASTPTADNEQ